ncbi:MAG: DNA methyltransferase [Gammaproteobacteria bacterium]
MTKKRQIWIHDNLPVLRCLDSESADLIYLDPPFNSGKQWESPIGGKKGRAKAAFKDTWNPSDTHIDEEYELANSYPHVVSLIRSLYEINGGSWWAYLIYMAARLVEMRRILKPTGSIYYHCDTTMSHGVKLVMDSIFGKGNFRNEIVWHYGGRGAKSVSKQFPRNGDAILFYTKNASTAIHRQTYCVKIPLKNSEYRRDESGRYFRTAPRGCYTDESVRRLEKEGRIYRTRNGTIRVKYFEESDGEFVYEHKQVGNVWNDIPDAMHTSKKEGADYPTRKPAALLERIIAASSNEGDVVLDPFCGCGTTMLVADKLNRQWIGIDISDEAVRILRDRLPLFNEAADGSGIEEFARTLPKRSDIPKMPAAEKERLREDLYREQKGRCAAPCGENGGGVKIELRQMHLDHKTAEARGGQTVAHNMQLLCPHCNSTKGADGQTRFYRRILENAIENKFREHQRAAEKKYRAQMEKIFDR